MTDAPAPLGPVVVVGLGEIVGELLADLALTDDGRHDGRHQTRSIVANGIHLWECSCGARWLPRPGARHP